MKPTLYSNAALCLCISLIHAISLSQVGISPDKPDGIYQTGETVTWTIERTGDRVLDSLHYPVSGRRISIPSGRTK